MNRSSIISIGMLIAFFLPWYHISIFTFSGYDIPNTLERISNLADTFKSFTTKSDDDLETYKIVAKFTYILYLIPFFSLINIGENFSEKKLPVTIQPH